VKREAIRGAPGLYAKLLPEIIEVAKKCGYAIGIHGSMSHDLDLIAVPWVYNALPGTILVERIAGLVGGHIDVSGTTVQSPSPEDKPHGRTGWCIYFNRRFTGPYIDISVTPRIDYKTKQVVPDDEVSP